MLDALLSSIQKFCCLNFTAEWNGIIIIETVNWSIVYEFAIKRSTNFEQIRIW